MAYNGPTPLLVPIGGTGASSFTAYSVICGGTTSTGNLQNVSGVGTSGQILESQGASALPQCASISGSNLVLLQSQATGTSTTLTFNTNISSTYDSYLFILSNVIPSSSDVLIIKVNGDSSGYLSGCQAFESYSSSTLTNTNSTSSILLTNEQTNSAPGLSGNINFYNVTSGNNPSWFGITVGNNTNGSTTGMQYVSGTTTNTTITSFVFSWSGGADFTNVGTISLFGILE